MTSLISLILDILGHRIPIGPDSQTFTRKIQICDQKKMRNNTEEYIIYSFNIFLNLSINVIVVFGIFVKKVTHPYTIAAA